MTEIRIDGENVRVEPDTTVAAALLNAGIWRFRVSVTQQPRAPLCGMGICYECRVAINGEPHQRACMRIVEPGMEITTGG